MEPYVGLLLIVILIIYYQENCIDYKISVLGHKISLSNIVLYVSFVIFYSVRYRIGHDFAQYERVILTDIAIPTYGEQRGEWISAYLMNLATMFDEPAIYFSMIAIISFFFIIYVFNGSSDYKGSAAWGMVENGAHVCAVISKSVCNLSDWEKLPIRLYKIDTYTSKKEFLFNTIKFCLLKGKLKKDLLKEEFDFIYVPMATYWTSIINGLLSNIPVCYTVHDPIMHSGEGIFNKIMFRQYSRDIHKANLLVVLSKSFIEPVSKIYNKEIENIIYIPHGAFWEYKKYGNNFNHKIVSYDEDKINFLFFGRIEEYKGIDVLLDAYQKLENYYPQKTSLTIAGRGDIAKYQNKINKFESVYVLNRMILDSEISSLYAGNNWSYVKI